MSLRVSTNGRALARGAALAAVAAMVATLLSAVTVSGATSASGAEPTAEPTAQRTAGARPWYGSSVYRENGETMREAYDRVRRKYGGSLDTVRMFFPGMPGSWSTIRKNVGRTPVVVSFKADPAAILAGRHDAAFRTWFREAPTKRRTFWTYWHEPENDSVAPSTYRAAWQHLSRLADQAGNRKLKATLILMCWTLDAKSGRTWKSWYPGSKAIDVLGFDCYNVGRKNGVYKHPEDILRPVVRVSRRTGKPFGIAEFGTVVIEGDGGRRGRARWLRQYAREVRQHGGRFATYFDSPVGGVDFRLKDTVSKQAWREVVQTW